MRRTVIIRRTQDAGGIAVRCGETVLGTVTGIAGGKDDAMSGTFTHRPAFGDVAEAFASLAAALAGGAATAAVAARLRAEVERRGVMVWHSAHDMRIDVAETIEIAKGVVRFRALGAFLAMRTGGLG